MKTWIKANFSKKIREGQFINKYVSGPYCAKWHANLVKQGLTYDKFDIDLIQI